MMRSVDFGHMVSPRGTRGAGLLSSSNARPPRGALLTLAKGGAARLDPERFRRAHLNRPESPEGRAVARELAINSMGMMGGAGIGVGLGRLALRYGLPHVADVSRMLRFGQARDLDRFGPLGLKRAMKALPTSMLAEEPAFAGAEGIAEMISP